MSQKARGFHQADIELVNVTLTVIMNRESEDKVRRQCWKKRCKKKYWEAGRNCRIFIAKDVLLENKERRKNITTGPRSLR